MSEAKERKTRKTRYFDYNLLFLLIFLIAFGLIMLYSSSSYTAANNKGNSAYYLIRQLKAIGVGCIPLIITIIVPYQFWKKLSLLPYAVAIALNVAVLIPGVGSSSHGSSRWLGIGSLSFQPSEVAKLAMIFTMAFLIDRAPKVMGEIRGIVFTIIALAVMAGLVAIENLSTAVIIAGVTVGMIFVASKQVKPFFAIAGVGAVALALFIFGAGYRSDRISGWLHPENSYQTMMGLYAIGSGGLFGKGLGESLQKMGHVPESQNDFIFTIICEELGLFGAVCVILLYALIIWRMVVIANNAKDIFGSMLVSGVMIHISLQVILNIAVVTNSIPNTGVTLPFISYGGTSIVFLLSEMGLVLGVSRGIRLESIKR